MMTRTKEQQQAYYQKNKSKIISRVAKWQKDNRERQNETQRKWRAANPDRNHELSMDWRYRNKEKRKAHRIVETALKTGKLISQPCFCGSMSVHAHHDDYDKPLEVDWLCPQHHKDKHAKLKGLTI